MYDLRYTDLLGLQNSSLFRPIGQDNRRSKAGLMTVFIGPLPPLARKAKKCSTCQEKPSIAACLPS